MTDLDKDATIRARWPGEAGQHLALATVSATKLGVETTNAYGCLF